MDDISPAPETTVDCTVPEVTTDIDPPPSEPPPTDTADGEDTSVPPRPPSRTGGATRVSRHDSHDKNKRGSRASSKSGRRSRSLSRVSIEKNSQTQSEVDEAAKSINSQPGGPLLLSLIQEINKQPGTNIDLLTIAKQVEKEKAKASSAEGEEEVTSEKQSQPNDAACTDIENSDPILNNRAQFIMKSPYYNRTQDRQHIRDTPLDIELNDRTVQRRMINPPCHFHEGHSSISDNDQVRLDKVKIYFSAAFSNKKFSGKRTRGNEDLSILQLLQDFNHAQSTIAVTEREFITFLTKAMTGEAHKTMLNYQDLHRNGAMSIEDIYLSLTDIYFSDLRPNTAM